MREPSDYSDQFAEHLRTLGIEPTLAGALAAAKYRQRKRFITDVDFMVPSFGDVAERLAAEGYDVKAMSEPDGEPYLVFVRQEGGRYQLPHLPLECV